MNTYTLIEKIILCSSTSFMPIGIIMCIGYFDKHSEFGKGSIQILLSWSVVAFFIGISMLYIFEKYG